MRNPFKKFWKIWNEWLLNEPDTIRPKHPMDAYIERLQKQQQAALAQAAKPYAQDLEERMDELGERLSGR